MILLSFWLTLWRVQGAVAEHPAVCTQSHTIVVNTQEDEEERRRGNTCFRPLHFRASLQRCRTHPWIPLLLCQQRPSRRLLTSTFTPCSHVYLSLNVKVEYHEQQPASSSGRGSSVPGHRVRENLFKWDTGTHGEPCLSTARLGSHLSNGLDFGVTHARVTARSP